ncbi:MAG TPA: hypothetical protein VG838_07615 [Opitutaceae bacterium]|nr:hypothetical protein [Opitutaceae bacterium]
MLRPSLTLALGFLFSSSLQAGVPEPLDEAFQKLARDNGSWAYTQVSVSVDKDGKRGPETVFVFDPSKPFPEQFTPLKIKGQPPTEKQLAQYRRMGEARERRLERQTDSARDELLRLNVSGRWVIVDLEHATVTETKAAALVYDIPLLPDGPGGLPVDQFRLVAHVNKADRVFEQAEITLRSPLKLGTFAKLNALSYAFGFARVDEKYSPAPTALHIDLSGAMFFFGRRDVTDITRRDFRHVTPYRSRFDVKIGPMRTIDF